MKMDKLLREFVGKVDKDNYNEALELQEMIIEEKSKHRIKKASKRSFKTLQELDEEHALKIKEAFKKVEEAHSRKLKEVEESIEYKHGEQLQSLLESIDIEHTEGLKQLSNHYEQKLKNIKDR